MYTSTSDEKKLALKLKIIDKKIVLEMDKKALRSLSCLLSIAATPIKLSLSSKYV